jgi:hypothetical protein
MGKLKVSQEDIVLTAGNSAGQFTSTDNITNLVGIGDDLFTALQDHIVELILYYEKKLRLIDG